VNFLGIDQVFLTVGDLDAAIVHYTGTLGLALRHRSDAGRAAVFAVGAEGPGLTVRAAPGLTGSGPRARLWLEVADTRAVAAELQARGVTILGPPLPTADGWLVEVADPWGNVVGLVEHTQRPEPDHRAARRAATGHAAGEPTGPPTIPEDLLTEALETLSTREQEVVRYRFGVQDGEAHTLDETGRAFRVTRERVRQIEMKLIRQVQQSD